MLTDFQNTFADRLGSELLVKWQRSHPSKHSLHYVVKKCLWAKMAMVQNWVKWTAMQASIIQTVTKYILQVIFASFLGRLRVGLIKRVSNVRSYVRLSTSLISMNVGRGRWLMHDGMQYDPNQGQGHEPLKVGNLTIFKGCLLPHLQCGLANVHRFLN